MLYLACRHHVKDYREWHRVFADHAEAQRKAGLQLLHVLRDITNPNFVVLLFQIEDMDKARAFTESPNAREAAESSGVIGIPEIQLLTDD